MQTARINYATRAEYEPAGLGAHDYRLTRNYAHISSEKVKTLGITFEIDENLIRSNLTTAQEAAAIHRRKAIYEELHPETKHGGNAGPCGQFAHTEAESFSRNTARAIGKHRATIDRAVARGEALGDDLNALTGTSLDKGVELDALAKMEPEQRACQNPYSLKTSVEIRLPLGICKSLI